LRGDNLARRRGNARKWTRARAGAFLAFLTVFLAFLTCVDWQVSRGIAFASLHAIEQT
jgi:hypothetical protein